MINSFLQCMDQYYLHFISVYKLAADSCNTFISNCSICMTFSFMVDSFFSPNLVELRSVENILNLLIIDAAPLPHMLFKSLPIIYILSHIITFSVQVMLTIIFMHFHTI